MYPNGDIGVGDPADIKIRLKPGEAAFEWFRVAVDQGTVEVETLGGGDAAMTAPRAAIHEHGELGPVLGAPGDHFTGPSALN